MKFPRPLIAEDLAKRFGATIIGMKDRFIYGINEIHKVEQGDLTFADVPKYAKKAVESAAAVIILPEAMPCPEEKAIIVYPKPFQIYNKLISENRPFRPLNTNVSMTADVHPSAVLEPGVIVGHHSTIGRDCYIQANTIIGSYVTIENKVTIEPNCSIGTDAFYFNKVSGSYQPWWTGGRVIIKDAVFIGAGSTVSKGVSGDTLIGYGTKIDCQVHVGHGTVIGENCLIAAQVGIAGKVTIEDNVTIYGQAGIAHGLHIAKGATILAKAGVSKSLKKAVSYFGTPAVEARTAYKEMAALRSLPQFFQEKDEGEK